MVYALEMLRKSWLRSLRSVDAPDSTINTYDRAVLMFLEFLADPPATTLSEHEESAAALLERLPVQDEGDIRREHVEAWIAHLWSQDFKRNTVATRYAGLRVWFTWMCEQGDLEMRSSPMATMRRVPVPVEVHVPVVGLEEIRKLLATCDRTTFRGKRDEAIIRLFCDTGLRVAEMVGLNIVEEIEGRRVPFMALDTSEVFVWAKGRRWRNVSFGDKTGLSIDRYLRARRKHKHAKQPPLWLPQREGPQPGRLTDDGIRSMIEARCKQAGIPHIHPHQLRHTWADAQKRAGLSHEDLKRMGGWRSDNIVERYGAAMADERAKKAHRDRSFGDTF